MRLLYGGVIILLLIGRALSVDTESHSHSQSESDPLQSASPSESSTPNSLPCNESTWWYDDTLNMPNHGVVNCGTWDDVAVMGDIEAGDTNASAYCQDSPYCPPHLRFHKSVAATHIMGNNSIFGIPMEFGASSWRFEILASLSTDCSGLQIFPEIHIRDGDDCGDTAIFPHPVTYATRTTDPMQCGEITLDNYENTVYTKRYVWDMVDSATFAPGRWFTLYWVNGDVSDDTNIRIYDFSFSAGTPAGTANMAIPYCDAPMAEPECSQSRRRRRRRESNRDMLDMHGYLGVYDGGVADMYGLRRDHEMGHNLFNTTTCPDLKRPKMTVNSEAFESIIHGTFVIPHIHYAGDDIDITHEYPEFFNTLFGTTNDGIYNRMNSSTYFSFFYTIAVPDTVDVAQNMTFQLEHRDICSPISRQFNEVEVHKHSEASAAFKNLSGSADFPSSFPGWHLYILHFDWEIDLTSEDFSVPIDRSVFRLYTTGTTGAGMAMFESAMYLHDHTPIETDVPAADGGTFLMANIPACAIALGLTDHNCQCMVMAEELKHCRPDCIRVHRTDSNWGKNNRHWNLPLGGKVKVKDWIDWDNPSAGDGDFQAICWETFQTVIPNEVAVTASVASYEPFNTTVCGFGTGVEGCVNITQIDRPMETFDVCPWNVPVECPPGTPCWTELRCNLGSTICNITFADYGDADCGISPYDDCTLDNQCNHDVRDVVADLCVGQQSCILPITDAIFSSKTNGDDQCKGGADPPNGEKLTVKAQCCGFGGCYEGVITPSASESMSESPSMSPSDSSSESASMSPSHSSSASMSMLPFRAEDGMSYGMGAEDVVCMIDQTSYWYDGFGEAAGEIINCGGGATNHSVPGEAGWNTTYCKTMEPACYPHIMVSNSNRSTHVLRANELFGVPTAFGEATFSMHVVFTSTNPVSPLPTISVYSNCNNTDVVMQHMYDEMLMPDYPKACGEDNSTTTYYEFRWQDLPTTGFAPGMSLVMEWLGGGVTAAHPISIFEYEIAVDRPYYRRSVLIPPKCDARLYEPFCADEPEARRGRDRDWFAPEPALTVHRRRREEPDLCVTTAQREYVLILLDSSESLMAELPDYLAAVEGIIDLLEGSPVGVAIVDFDGPLGFAAEVGSTAGDTRWLTPFEGASGVYRHMDNATEVALIRGELNMTEAGGGTNWEAAFDRANTLVPAPNTTVFITDGNPVASNTYCSSDAADNTDVYASEAGDDAATLEAAGSRILPVFVGSAVTHSFATTLVVSDGQKTNVQFCTPDPPSSFTPTALIASNVSLEPVLVEGVDYFSAANATDLADVIDTEIFRQLCTPPSQSRSRSQSWSSSHSRSPTPSSSHSRSRSESGSQSPSVSQSHSLSQSPSRSSSHSRSASSSVSQSRSRSPSESRSESGSQSPSVSQSRSRSNSRSSSLSRSHSPSLSRSSSRSRSSSLSTSRSQSHSLSQSPSRSSSRSRSASSSESQSRSRSGSRSVSESESPSTSQSRSRSNSRSSSLSHSRSPSQSTSQSHSLSQSPSRSSSRSRSSSLSTSQSRSGSRSRSASESESPSTSQSRSQSGSRSSSLSRSHSPSLSRSSSRSRSASESNSRSPSLSRSRSPSQSTSQSHSLSHSPSRSLSRSGSASSSKSQTQSRSASLSTSRSLSASGSESPSTSQSRSQSGSRSLSLSRSHSPSQSTSQSRSLSRSPSRSLSRSRSASASTSESQSPSASQSRSTSQTSSRSRSHTTSLSQSRSRSESHSPSRSQSRSRSQSQSQSESQSTTQSRSASSSRSRSATHTGSGSRSLSQSRSESISRETKSHSLSHSHSTSNSYTRSLSASHSVSHSVSRSVSSSRSLTVSRTLQETKSQSQSHSQSQTPSESQSQSQSPPESESRSQSQSDILIIDPTGPPSGSQSNSGSNTNSESNSQSQSESPTRSQSESQSQSQSQSQSLTQSQSQSQSQTMGIQGCAITALCLISNIVPQGGLQECEEQIIERRSDPTLPHILQNHVNFTWVNQTNHPDASATITLKINSNLQGCPVEWSGVAEGVPSNTPNPITNNNQYSYLVHEGVNFGGDWLNYRIWVNDTECSPYIEELFITYADPETPCECQPDPQFKPEIIGICTPDPCNHTGALAFFGDSYECICGEGEYDRCGVCDGDGRSCFPECCERVTPEAPLMAPYPYWNTYKRCEDEEDELPMEGMCYTIRSILADPIFDFPPPFGLRVGELTCDLSHDASQVLLCVEQGGLHFNGTVWCGFDSAHDNHHGDGYEAYQPPHPYHFNMWFTEGVDFSMPGMISVVEPGYNQSGDVSANHCGYLISSIDDKDVTKVCAKANDDGLQLKITNGTNDFWEPGITGQGWFMNMNCSMPCDYCGNHYEEGNTDPNDMQRCNPGDWMWVLEAKCNLNSQSASQSTSPSQSTSLSQSTSPSQSSSQSESSSQSPSRSTSQSPSYSESTSPSHSVSMSTSPLPCCQLWAFFPNFIFDNRTCPVDFGDYVPNYEFFPCWECMCDENYEPADPLLDPIGLGCCNTPGEYPTNNATCGNPFIVEAVGCFSECCYLTIQGPCDEVEDECSPPACCCNPFIVGCPAIEDNCTAAVLEIEPLCELWFENSGNLTGFNGSAALETACTNIHANHPLCCNQSIPFDAPDFCEETLSYSQSTSPSLSTSPSQSSSTSQSCPELEIPPPPCDDRREYDNRYHPETWDCVCQSGPWRCGECNGESATECECPCRMVVDEQGVCDLYPHIPPAECLFYQDCHPADEPQEIDYFKMYGLRSHSGWLKNDSFIDDQKKAPPLFGIVIGELVLDFSHKNSHVKMIVNWDSLHITGHAWGGYDLNNAGDNGIWDGWEALENMEPRVGPWKIDIWYTDGFQHDFSGVTGEPGEVSDVNCGTITDPKDWNNTIEICAKADDEGYQLRLANDYHGETGISGFGWFHNVLCDDRCDQFLNRYHCPDADMHFVLESECGDVDSPSESASPSPPKEPCCMRMSPVRFPNETFVEDSASDYDYDIPLKKRGIVATPTPEPEHENELIICDPSLSPFMIMPGADYQLRDHFSIQPNVLFPPPEGSIPGFPGFIYHGGLRFGELIITFTEEGTLMKMTYTPGQDSVFIKGHGWGRVIDDETGELKRGFEVGTPLGPQFYHVEVEYVAGLHHVHGIKRIPRGGGGIPFLVRERDPETEKPIEILHSKLNRGLLYPKDHPDLVIEFGAMDLPNPMIPDLITSGPIQFAIISNADLNLGVHGGFHGLGGLWVNCSELVTPRRRGLPPAPEDATRINLLRQMCTPQDIKPMPWGDRIDVPDGSGWLNFVIEGECPCDNPSPTPGFCPEHGVYHNHGDPAENSLSHSQSPLQSNVPHPPLNVSLPGQGFPLAEGASIVAVQMTETTLPPEKWDDPAVEYRRRYSATWDGDLGYVVFTSEAFTTPYRFVTYNVAPAPRRQSEPAGSVYPGREWIFVQIQWSAAELPANFITKIGAGGVGDESPEKVQCGEGGGKNYTECWINFPPYGGVLYIGAATQPFYHLDAEVELIGVNLTMLAENKQSFVRHVGMGIYAPYDPNSSIALGSDQYNYLVYGMLGLGFAGMAAGVMLYRPKSAAGLIQQQQQKQAPKQAPTPSYSDRDPEKGRTVPKGKRRAKATASSTTNP